MSITNITNPGQSPVDGDYVTDGSKTWPYTAPTSATVYTVFDGASWREYAYGVLGAIAAPSGTDAEKAAAGFARYGQIIKDGRASTEPTVFGALDQYDDASRFRKDKVTIFLGVLNGTDPKIVTDAELAAIIGNWP